MATQQDLREQQKRLTWTPFHLRSSQPWPIWPDVSVSGANQSLDPHLGYLCDVQGVENVRLARRVENVEQAVFIILWSSAEALNSFQTSPLFSTFLNALDSSCILSTERTSASSKGLVSLQWEHGFDMDTELYGRITLCKYTGIGSYHSWHSGWRNAVVGFMPLGCDSIARKRPPMLNWCVTWVDKKGGEQQGRDLSDWLKPVVYATETNSDQEKETEAEDKEKVERGGEHVRERWEFLRWNVPKYGATREREEESVKLPGAWQHWEQAFKRYMPPVQAWEQERWDISTPHQSPKAKQEEVVEYDEDFEDNEYEEDDEDDSMGDIEEDHSLPAIEEMKIL